MKTKQGFGKVGLLILIAIIIAVVGGFYLANTGDNQIKDNSETEKNGGNITDNLNETTDLETYRNEEYGFEIEYPEDMIINEFVEENCKISGKTAQISFTNSDVKIFINERCKYESPFGDQPNIFPFTEYTVPFSGPVSTNDCAGKRKIASEKIVECNNLNDNTRLILSIYTVPNISNIFSAIAKKKFDASSSVEVYYGLIPASQTEIPSEEYNQKKEEYLNKVKNNNLSHEEVKEMERITKIQIKKI